MEENELNSFLGGHPDSSHPKDRIRFIKYALECIKNGKSLNIEAMKQSGNLSDSRIEYYGSAYSWIRDTYDFLKEKGLLNI